MPKLLRWCDEATVVHWHQETGALPDWPEAHRRMISDGKVTKVHHPSLEHATWQFPPAGVGRLNGKVQPVAN